MESDFKETRTIQRKKSDLLNSPIVTDKSSYFGDKFSFNKSDKIAKNNDQEDEPQGNKSKSAVNILDIFSAQTSKSFSKSKIEEASDEKVEKKENITLLIMDDIERVEPRKSEKPSKTNTKLNAKSAPSLPNKPITDYFSNFKYAKPDSLKLKK